MCVTNVQVIHEYAKVVKHVYLLSSRRNSCQNIIVQAICWFTKQKWTFLIIQIQAFVLIEELEHVFVTNIEGVSESLKVSNL